MSSESSKPEEKVAPEKEPSGTGESGSEGKAPDPRDFPVPEERRTERSDIRNVIEDDLDDEELEEELEEDEGS